MDLVFGLSEDTISHILSTFAHETIEAITNPFGGAWFNLTEKYSENADLCGYVGYVKGLHSTVKIGNQTFSVYNPNLDLQKGCINGTFPDIQKVPSIAGTCKKPTASSLIVPTQVIGNTVFPKAFNSKCNGGSNVFETVSVNDVKFITPGDVRASISYRNSTHIFSCSYECPVNVFGWDGDQPVGNYKLDLKCDFKSPSGISCNCLAPPN